MTLFFFLYFFSFFFIIFFFTISFFFLLFDAFLFYTSTSVPVRSSGYIQHSIIGFLQYRHHHHHQDKQRKQMKALKRMVLFPLILILGYLVGTIRRIVDAFGVETPFWFAVLQITLNGLIPIADALVYGLTEDVRTRLCRACNDEEDEEED